MAYVTQYSMPGLFMAVFFGLWLPGYALAFTQSVLHVADDYARYRFALFGMLGGLAAYANVYSRYYKIPGYDAIVGSAFLALILGRNVNAVHITSKGVFYDCADGFGGSYGGILIHLAPYYFPGGSLAVAMIPSFIVHHNNPLIHFFIGFVLSFEIIRIFRELYLSLTQQSFDVTFQNIGYLKALVITSFLSVFFVGIVISCLMIGASGASFFIKKGFYISAGMLHSLASSVF